MVTIELFDHPLLPQAPKRFEAESVGAWMLAHYGDRLSCLIQVFRGQPAAANEITNDLPALLETEGHYTVLQSPGSDVNDFVRAALNPYVYLSNLALKTAVKAFIPDISMPGNVNRTQQSPNNALGNRQNQLRLMERVEDIFGTVRSIPSLLQQTYSKYVDHVEYEYSYMCVGRGYYEIDDVRDGDTLCSDIDGTSVEFYDPFTSPNSGAPMLSIGVAIGEPVLTVTRSNNVDGITLLAPNQANLKTSDSYTFKTAASQGSTGDRIEQSTRHPAFSSVLSVGDQITVTGTNAGTYTVAALVSDQEIELTTATFAGNSTQTCSIAKVGGSEYTDWITLKDEDMTQVVCNILAPNGMYKDAGEGRLRVYTDYEIQVEELDGSLTPTGNVITETGTLDGRTTNLRAVTHEVDLTWVGPCRVRMRRTDDFGYGFAGTIIDEIKWADLYAVTPVAEAHFGNVTTVQIVTRATRRALSVKERQFNCKATRRLPTFNGSTFSGVMGEDGSIVSGTITGTNRFIDILAAVTIDPYIGRRTINDVDLGQVWEVFQQVEAWNPLCAEFSYTLDSDNLSFEETVKLIADACFCQAYRQNGKIRFAFNQAQTSSTALFTHRNKRPASDAIVRRFASEADYNGVELIYNDAVSDQSETIKLPLDGSATKYKKFEIAGIRNYEQAWYRAYREYQKLTLQRVSIDTETTSDGRLLLPNDRIDIVDNTRFDAMDGEVIGQSGLELTLSRDVTFGDGPHSILLMRRDGSLESIACTAGGAANKVVLASLPGEAIVTTAGEEGVRTIFSFASDSARDAQAYLVQEVEVQDSSYVKVRAINYDPGYFTGDTADIPARALVL